MRSIRTGFELGIGGSWSRLASLTLLLGFAATACIPSETRSLDLGDDGSDPVAPVDASKGDLQADAGDASRPTPDAATTCAACLPEATCQVDGARVTCQCPAGFAGDGTSAGTGCADVDECTASSDCVAPSSGGACSNTRGGYTCGCQPGYVGDGKASGSGCVDVDECASANDCVGAEAGGACRNVAGGYTCACKPGYTGDGKISGSGCSELDECAGGSGCVDPAAGGACANSAFGFTCSCQSGYEGDGKVSGSGCTDIDECSLPSTDCESPLWGGACTNFAGGHTCGCQPGYEGDGKWAGTACVDIDECARSNDCVADADGGRCSNVSGGYACSCKAGYTGDGNVSGLGCTDTDECSGPNECVSASGYGTCSNTEGGYICGCTSPYSGDGRTTGKGCQWLPDLLWYRFDGDGEFVENHVGNPPFGTDMAFLQGGLTQASAGQCRTALVETGASGSSDYLETGWPTNLSGSWTISFWTSNIASAAPAMYAFGDPSANGFRCFANGVAGLGNWTLRGGGISEITATGGATLAPAVTTFVYDASAPEIRAYVNGVRVATEPQPPLTIVGSAFTLGYASSAGLSAGALMDEFRLYSVALPDSEVAKLAQTAEVCK